MTSYFQHAKFKAPVANMRNAVGAMWRNGSSVVGLYEPLSPEEREPVFGEPVNFRGDIPKHAGDQNHQHRMHYAAPRPIIENVENLLVTPSGGGWCNGTLFERFSSCKPGLRMLFEQKTPVREVENGYFVQSEHIDTFGDWTSEYLNPLAGVDNIDAPVFLPATFANKPYVKRDAARLGIDFSILDTPVLIKNARVVRQQMYIRYWLPEYALRLREFYKADPVTPKPGSMIYLSRHGEPSEVAVRTYPNRLIEEMVKSRGGTVLRTNETSFESYVAAAAEAETVLLDHGSAGYNLVYWQPKRVIEFVSDAWWMNSFLFFAKSLGIDDYGIICTDYGNNDAVATRLNALLDEPIS